MEELLRKGEIRVAIKWAEWEWWKELSYEDFIGLKDIDKETFKIVSKNEKVPSNPKKWKTKSKSLFPSSWRVCSEKVCKKIKLKKKAGKDIIFSAFLFL